MDDELLAFILQELEYIRDGLLDDSSITRAAFHLGGLITALEMSMIDLE